MERPRRRRRFRGFRATVTRPALLPGLVTYYRSRFSKIPDSVRVSFGNGTTAVYDLHVQQPAPVIWKHSRSEVVGYQWKGARR